MNAFSSNFLFFSHLDDATPDEIENLLKELSVMKMVGKHVNIISLLGSCTKGGESNFLLSFCRFFYVSLNRSSYAHR